MAAILFCCGVDLEFLERDDFGMAGERHVTWLYRCPRCKREWCRFYDSYPGSGIDWAWAAQRMSDEACVPVALGTPWIRTTDYDPPARKRASSTVAARA